MAMQKLFLALLAAGVGAAPQGATGKDGAFGAFGGLLDAFRSTGTQMKPFDVKDIEPLLEKDAKRQIIRWGPFELKPPGVSCQFPRAARHD
jgi:hypothetical protein